MRSEKSLGRVASVAVSRSHPSPEKNESFWAAPELHALKTQRAWRWPLLAGTAATGTAFIAALTSSAAFAIPALLNALLKRKVRSNMILYLAGGAPIDEKVMPLDHLWTRIKPLLDGEYFSSEKVILKLLDNTAPARLQRTSLSAFERSSP